MSDNREKKKVLIYDDKSLLTCLVFCYFYSSTHAAPALDGDRERIEGGFLAFPVARFYEGLFLFARRDDMREGVDAQVMK